MILLPGSWIGTYKNESSTLGWFLDALSLLWSIPSFWIDQFILSHFCFRPKRKIVKVIQFSAVPCVPLSLITMMVLSSKWWLPRWDHNLLAPRQSSSHVLFPIMVTIQWFLVLIPLFLLMKRMNSWCSVLPICFLSTSAPPETISQCLCTWPQCHTLTSTLAMPSQGATIIFKDLSASHSCFRFSHSIARQLAVSINSQ